MVVFADDWPFSRRRGRFFFLFWPPVQASGGSLSLATGSVAREQQHDPIEFGRGILLPWLRLTYYVRIACSSRGIPPPLRLMGAFFCLPILYKEGYQSTVNYNTAEFFRLIPI